MLDDLVSKYNNSYHETIRMRPIDASKIENESEVWGIFSEMIKKLKNLVNLKSVIL